MGGHVFKSVTKIRKSHIEPTLNHFRKDMIYIFPNCEEFFDKFITLGSVGKKEFSGDIDLAFDENILKDTKRWNLNKDDIDLWFNIYKKRARTATNEQLLRRAILHEICFSIQSKAEIFQGWCDDKSSGNGMLSIEYPQFVNDNIPNLDENGQPLFVQIDLMFGNIDWLRFSYYSDIYKGNVKGLHRTQLLVHLFSYKGYSFSHNQGVTKKDTRKLVADTPEKCILLLNQIYNINIDRQTLSNYFSLQEYLKNYISIEDLNRVYDIYLKTLDSTRCDIPEDLQQYWINNQERLQLTGKFLPQDSKLYKYVDETYK